MTAPDWPSSVCWSHGWCPGPGLWNWLFLNYLTWECFFFLITDDTFHQRPQFVPDFEHKGPGHYQEAKYLSCRSGCLMIWLKSNWYSLTLQFAYLFRKLPLYFVFLQLIKNESEFFVLNGNLTFFWLTNVLPFQHTQKLFLPTWWCHVVIYYNFLQPGQKNSMPWSETMKSCKYFVQQQWTRRNLTCWRIKIECC